MENLRIRCRSCEKEIEGNAAKSVSCGCSNMATIIRTEQNSTKRFYQETVQPVKLPTAEIKLDASKTYQSMIGFGGAFTESSAYNLLRINTKAREQAIKDYNAGLFHTY